MKIEIRDENARAFSLFMNRITYEDAYRRTDCGFTEENRKTQAYKFLAGVAEVEKSLNEQIALQRKKEEQTQGVKR